MSATIERPLPVIRVLPDDLVIKVAAGEHYSDREPILEGEEAVLRVGRVEVDFRVRVQNISRGSGHGVSGNQHELGLTLEVLGATDGLYPDRDKQGDTGGA